MEKFTEGWRRTSLSRGWVREVYCGLGVGKGLPKCGVRELYRGVRSEKFTQGKLKKVNVGWGWRSLPRGVVGAAYLGVGSEKFF